MRCLRIVSSAAMLGIRRRLTGAMTDDGFCERIAAEVAAAAFPSAAVVRFARLRGGLEAAVARLTLLEADRSRRSVVVKRLPAAGRRERDFYSLLDPHGVTPALLGVVERAEATYLLLEEVRAVSNWPWRDSFRTRLVLEQLARIHAMGHDVVPGEAWDYEGELRESAEATLSVASDRARSLGGTGIVRHLPALRRVVAAVPDMRRRMSAAAGRTLIHGDVHTGNVVISGAPAGERVVLLDWGRSRIGSPLEDVSSWLLSLRIWEPAAARDHDSLFRSYLAAAGFSPELTPELRTGYWFAAASNVLAGALRYHLLVAAESSGRRRETAVAQACAALRVVRRADERLRGRHC